MDEELYKIAKDHDLDYEEAVELQEKSDELGIDIEEIIEIKDELD